MDINITDIVLPIVTAVVSGWGSWFFARKKYDAEVENQKIENTDKAMQVYQKLLDDVNTRLDDALNRNIKLEQEVADLRKQVFDLTMNICMDLSCAHRVKELKKGIKNSNKPKEE